MELCIVGHEKSESNIRLLEEAKKQFGSVFFVPIDGIMMGLTEKFSLNYRASDIFKFKAIFPRVPRKFYSYAYQLLSLFEPETFMSIKPISFLLAAERFFLLTVLRKRGVPTLNLHLARSSKAMARVLEEEKFPLVIRTPDKETGVTVEGAAEAKTVIDALGTLKQPVLLEDLVKDLVSVYVAEPEVIAVVKKKAKEKDVIFAKGETKKHKIDLETQRVALDAMRAIDCQVARVDMSLNGGNPRVVNMNLNPPLIEPSKVTGVDIPRKIMESVRQNFEAHAKKPLLMKFFEDAKSVVKDVLNDKNLL